MLRSIAKILLFLGLGGCATVVSAWSCTEWSSMHRLPTSENAEWPITPRDNWAMTATVYKSVGFGITEFRAWGSADESRAMARQYVLRAGVPFRAVERVVMDTSYPGGDPDRLDLSADTFREGIDLRHVWPYPNREFPAQILPAGFMANMVVYGAFFAGIYALVLTFHRSRRRRLNRCIRCGYDLRGTSHPNCPECGEAIVRTAVK